jgi:hypothetical protein
VIRDIVRAVLVLVVLAVGCEIIAVHRGRQAPAPQPPAWQPKPVAYQPPEWQPVAPAWQPAQATPEPGPIRRVAKEFVDLAEATIGVIR